MLFGALQLDQEVFCLYFTRLKEIIAGAVILDVLFLGIILGKHLNYFLLQMLLKCLFSPTHRLLPPKRGDLEFKYQ